MLEWTKRLLEGLTEERLLQAAIAAGVAVAVYAVLVVLRRLVARQYKRYEQTTQKELAEIPLQAVSETRWPFLVAVAVYAGLVAFGLPDNVATVINKVMTIALFWQAGVWASAAASGALDRRRQLAMEQGRSLTGSIGILRFVSRVVIWALVLLLTLENLGVDITALVAGLGIGGIAVALAVQNVLGDLLASLSIALDEPFVIGDFVAVGDFLGSVEYVGIKSTRLRSLTGEQIVMSNADLLSSRLRNYGRMVERRIVFALGLTYETPRAKLEQVPGIVRKIVESLEDVRFDRCHFKSYGAFSLDFEIVYFVLSPDYNRYMDLQQQINFGIHGAFEELGVEFAYPTQTLWLASQSPLALQGAANGSAALES
jgi:small-conductance mechanosensitive channel